MKFGYLLLLVCATLASPALAVEDTAASCEADGSCAGEAEEEEALLQTRASSQAKQNLSRAEGRSSLPCETILCETDTQGDNMDTSPDLVGSYDECKAKCTSRDGCVGWTWKVFESQGSHECWLKRANGASKADSDSVSGTCDSPPPPEACGQPRCQWTTNGHNMEGIPNGQIMGSWEDCKRACGETPGCRHWTWKTEEPHRECWLKDSDDGPPPAEDKISVSGECSSTPTPTPPTPSPPPTPPTPPTPPAACGEPLCKYDTQGQNMGGENGKDAGSYDECLKRCSETPGCEHWTWKTEDPQQCWLKDSTTGNQPKHDDISVSGYCPELSSTPERPSGCLPRLCETSTEGHNMENQPSPHTDNEDECREWCSRTPDCKSWTWKTDGQCWLKDDKRAFEEITDKYSVSGYCH